MLVIVRVLAKSRIQINVEISKPAATSALAESSRSDKGKTARMTGSFWPEAALLSHSSIAVGFDL